MADQSQRTSGEASAAPGDGYAGDVTAAQAWSILKDAPDALLVDVRTQPEWVFVGVPDLSSIGKRASFVPWQVFPSMQVNAEFAKQVQAAGAAVGAPVLFLCRSGARSRTAAIALTAAGFEKSFNIAGGFEGDVDGEGHRGNTSGWKASGLPWQQG